MIKLGNSFDSDPFRIIQMNDLSEFISTQKEGSFYEFVGQEKNGMQIIFATKSQGDRSAWLTSLGMFTNVKNPISNTVHIIDGPEDRNTFSLQDSLKNEVRVTNQHIQEYIQLEISKSTHVNLDRSDKLLLLGLQDKLIKVAGNTDYISEKLSKIQLRE